MFELWRKRRELDKMNKLYGTEIRKARKEKKSSDEIDNLKYGLQVDTYFVEEEMNRLVTNHLVAKAQRLFLPVPAHDEEYMWERGNATGYWYLTPNGIMKLRNLIREETAARRRAFLDWTSPLIGVIGATTGLLAIILTMT